METTIPRTNALASIADELVRASKADARGDFPRVDCQRIMAQAGPGYENLASDLDTYSYDIWSPSSGVKKLSQKPEPWRRELKEYLSKSFFARYPKYAPLETMINQDDTPGLSRRLALFDQMRQNLLSYLSELER